MSARRSRWWIFAERFRRDDRLALAVTVTVCLAVVAGAYLFLIELPARRAQNEEQRQFQQMQLKAERVQPTASDQNVKQRNLAWEEILKKQRDPDYEIPLEKMRLIRKLWPELTSGLSQEDIGKIQKTLEQ